VTGAGPAPDHGPEVIRLDVPAAPDRFRLIRLLVSGLASQHDADLDDLEDLRLAVGEVCALVVDGAGDADRLYVSARVDERCVEVGVSVGPPDAPPAGGPTPPPGGSTDHVDDLVGALLLTVTDRFLVDHTDPARPAAWFERRLRGAAPPS
jgi:anti-sigma regulatory factor (Ser/Thr protein kinase)